MNFFINIQNNTLLGVNLNDWRPFWFFRSNDGMAMLVMQFDLNPIHSLQMLIDPPDPWLSRLLLNQPEAVLPDYADGKSLWLSYNC